MSDTERGGASGATSSGGVTGGGGTAVDTESGMGGAPVRDAGSGDAITPPRDAASAPTTSPAADAGFGVAGPSRCPGSSLGLCESFEDGLDMTVWRPTRSGDATVTVEEGHAARGTKALHVHTAGGGYGYITERSSFPAASTTLYARMFLWLQDPLTTDGHFSVAEGAGTGTPAAIRLGGQFKEFGVGTDRGASGDWTDRSNKKVPAQTWICLEVAFQGGTNEFRVWWDDVEIPTLKTGANRHPSFTMPTFNSLWFGWWMYNAREPQDLWIDEIAVDAKPIGCAR